MKKNKATSEEPGTSPEKETEDNLEKMAKKLTKEWNKPLKATEMPDLSFSTFEEKKKSRDQ